jgi:hypothetical protein
VQDGDAAPKVDEAAIGRIFREESGRSVAVLIRAFGDIDVAEDACRRRSPSPWARGQATACRPTRVAGSRRPPATVPSTASAASRGERVRGLRLGHRLRLRRGFLWSACRDMDRVAPPPGRASVYVDASRSRNCPVFAMVPKQHRVSCGHELGLRGTPSNRCANRAQAVVAASGTRAHEA